MIWAAERRPPSSEYLLKLDQPAIISPTTVSPPTAKKYSRPMFMSWPNRPGANGMTSRPMTVAMKTTTGARVKIEPIGAGRAEVLLRQHLQPVDHRQERAERPHPVRPDPQVHERDDLHLHVDDRGTRSGCVIRARRSRPRRTGRATGSPRGSRRWPPRTATTTISPTSAAEDRDEREDDLPAASADPTCATAVMARPARTSVPRRRRAEHASER